ncbi:MAG: alpha-L-fucosidase [Fimbriimonadaceae bacterium]|jgi:alpha-L-fucosidase|nr:alpha-L-fucosidase [Fimbriimonadaceae bacterium]
MQPWFQHSRFGIFLHWGIYSHGIGSESWAFFNGETTWDEYRSQAAHFTASAYDPDSWAKLFAEAGAGYVVLTAKHHDGFSLWDTAQSSWNAKEASPAGRDLIGPYCDALRRHGLKVGLYFSHLDWSHPDYATVFPKKAQAHDHAERHSNPFAYPQNGENPEAWERFLSFHRAQLFELCDRYSPDLLWFDGDWERDADQWRFSELRDQLKARLPQVILNSRMGGYGDYGTPEQAMPVSPPPVDWEFCVTINDSWGYQARDTHHKSPRRCVQILAECAGMGGNLLLDLGPLADGSLQAEQTKVLQEMGAWMKRNSSAIVGTKSGLPAGLHYGPSTFSQDGRRLNLICFAKPEEVVVVRGLMDEPTRAWVLGGGDLPVRRVGGAPWAGLPGTIEITAPNADELSPYATVICLEFAEPPRIYTGSGDAITLNP